MENKPSLGIKIYGWIEVSSIVTTFITLAHIDRYPLVLLYLPLVTIILGKYTLILNPIARRLNLFLSPLIVIVYTCGFMMLLEFLLNFIRPKFELTVTFFYFFYIGFLIIHIYFFSNPNIRKQFEIGRNRGESLHLTK